MSVEREGEGERERERERGREREMALGQFLWENILTLERHLQNVVDGYLLQ